MSEPDKDKLDEAIDEASKMKLTNSQKTAKRLYAQNLLTQQLIHDTQGMTRSMNELNDTMGSYATWSRRLTAVLIILSSSLLFVGLLELIMS